MMRRSRENQPQVRRRRASCQTAYSDEAVAFSRPIHEPPVTVKGMKDDAAKIGPPVELGHERLGRIALVNDNGEIFFPRNLQLALKCTRLILKGRALAREIESGFSDRYWAKVADCQGHCRVKV